MVQESSSIIDGKAVAEQIRQEVKVCCGKREEMRSDVVLREGPGREFETHLPGRDEDALTADDALMSATDESNKRAPTQPSRM